MVPQHIQASRLCGGGDSLPTYGAAGTENYLLHTKFLMLLGLSVIVIVVTWITLAIRLLAIGLLFIRNRMVYSISMALLLPSFAVSVIFIAHPIVRYLIHKLIG